MNHLKSLQQGRITARMFSISRAGFHFDFRQRLETLTASSPRLTVLSTLIRGVIKLFWERVSTGGIDSRRERGILSVSGALSSR